MDRGSEKMIELRCPAGSQGAPSRAIGTPKSAIMPSPVKLLTVLAYLSRYTHRVAIANSRLVAWDRANVTFRWKDYRADGRQKVMTLATGEFIRRFLIHVLPQGFHRIRHYGLFASATRADNIARARRLLDVPAAGDTNCAEATEPKPLSQPCPCCGGRMIIIERFQRGSSPRHRPAASPIVIRIDTS